MTNESSSGILGYLTPTRDQRSFAMTSVAEVAAALNQILDRVAQEEERASGFVQRRSKLGGAPFVKAVVLGWLAHPSASLGQLCQMAARLGVPITPQGLAQRFTTGATVFLQSILNAAVTDVVIASPVAIPILQRFGAVTIEDSSTVLLPAAWQEHFRGCGSGPRGGGESALKIDVRLDLANGRLEGPHVTEGRASDRRAVLLTTPVAPRALHLQDLGYFRLEAFAAIGQRGEYWLSRLQTQTAVFLATGERVPDLLTWLVSQRHAKTIDCPVTLGVGVRLPARLIVVRVPQAVAQERRRRLQEDAVRCSRSVRRTAWRLARWSLWVTNVPVELLSVTEVPILARARWQIELLFKLWKQQGHLDKSSSANPDRILCEIFAKLIVLVLQHWIVLATAWASPHRSYGKIAQILRDSAVLLAAAFVGSLSLTAVLTQIAWVAETQGRLNPRRGSPNTSQLLLAFPAQSLA
jgi:hypothetical protein